MKIAIAAKSPDITGRIDITSKHPSYWIIYNTFDHSFEVINNRLNLNHARDFQFSYDDKNIDVDMIITGSNNSSACLVQTPSGTTSISAHTMTAAEAIGEVLKNEYVQQSCHNTKIDWSQVSW